MRVVDKIFNRYKECGLDALNDRSRRPYRQANRLPFQVERSILGIKRNYPSWGAPKIHDKLIKQSPMIKSPAISTELRAAHEPNGLWCSDYKGEFMLGNKQYCYPLTLTDYRSRYLLACEGVTSTRSDNGPPFAAPNALFGLSRLSVWWLRLGIQIQRIKPGHPQQNGRHERMHLTLKQEATKPASGPQWGLSR